VRVPSGNDALVCLVTYGWRGGTTDSIIFRDFGSEHEADLYFVTDESQTCGFDPYANPAQDPMKPVTVSREFISAVEFEKR
jgi:hypothetical protein